MLQNSGTLEQALQDLKKFLHVHSQAGNIDFASSGNLLHITYTPLVSYQDSTRQLTDLTLAVGLSIVAGLSQHSFPLVSAYFTYKKPKNQTAYSNYFNCPIIFSAAENGVTVLRNVLENSLIQNKENVRGFLNDYLQNQEDPISY